MHKVNSCTHHLTHPPLQSHAIKTPHAIYCSGSIPVDAQGNMVEGTIQQKTEACIKNLAAVLKEAGSSIEKVVKVNIFLADMDNFAVSSTLLFVLLLNMKKTTDIETLKKKLTLPI